jgi:transcriptional regulator with XRE-family HTH domain
MDNLKRLRELKNLTQAEVAEKSGISRVYYLQLEKGYRGKKLPVTLAARIARVLDCSIDELYEAKEG